MDSNINDKLTYGLDVRMDYAFLVEVSKTLGDPRNLIKVRTNSRIKNDHTKRIRSQPLLFLT